MSDTTITKDTRWHAARRVNIHDQGLVIDDATGENIAVTYDGIHAPLVAAAPQLLHELEGLVETYAQALSDHIYDEDNGEPIPASELHYLNGLRSLIAEARGVQ